MNYAFDFQGKVFTPDGRIDIDAAKVAEHNKKLEATELAWLKTGPDKVSLYVQDCYSVLESTKPTITTFLGTIICTAVLGPKRYIGFGRNTYRRSVSCVMFGHQYHGWYMESSGDYCRLTRSKR